MNLYQSDTSVARAPPEQWGPVGLEVLHAKIRAVRLAFQRADKVSGPARPLEGSNAGRRVRTQESKHVPDSMLRHLINCDRKESIYILRKSASKNQCKVYDGFCINQHKKLKIFDHEVHEKWASVLGLEGQNVPLCRYKTLPKNHFFIAFTFDLMPKYHCISKGPVSNANQNRVLQTFSSLIPYLTSKSLFSRCVQQYCYQPSGKFRVI